MPTSFIRTLCPFAFGLLVLTMGSPTRANYTETVIVPNSATDFSMPLSFNSFNTSLGTLTGIVISYSDSAEMNGSIQNTSPSSSGNFTVKEDSNIQLNFGTTALLTNNLIASQSFTSLGPRDSTMFAIASPTGSASSMTISSGPLFNAFLEPSSNVMLNLGTLTSTTVAGGGGNISALIQTEVGATVKVTFDYTPFVTVPEPASMLMMSIGGLMLTASRFRKRRIR
jgi:PEP-CTERM motif